MKAHRFKSYLLSSTNPILMDLSGDHTWLETPVPIPNTAVKPARADDSRKAKVGRCLDFLPLTPRSMDAG